MLLGYNTNGLAHHDPLAAIDLLASIGYRSVALTIDHHLLNPFDPLWREQLVSIKERLERYGLGSVIETGARYLLDPTTKHEPTLVSADAAGRARRVEFFKHAIDAAAALNSDCVSLWSGVVHDGADQETAWSRLVDGLKETLDHAGGKSVTLGFEPEPGMLIDTMKKFDSLTSRVDHPSLRLTLDVGHLHCQGEVPLADYICRHARQIVNVHIEDMRAGIHEHLMFGEGEIDFRPVLKALSDVGYQGGVHVELSRHSHDGPRAARQAFDFLSRLVTG